MEIYIIDDDTIHCEVTADYIKKFGYTTEIFTSSVTAYQHLKTLTTPYIAIIDWMMPDLDGVELCQKLKAENTDTPKFLMLLTAKTSMEAKITGLDAGADDFISKPYDPRELHSRIHAAERIINLEASLLSKNSKLNELNKQLSDNLETIRNDAIAGQKTQEKLLPQKNMEHADYLISHFFCPSLYLSGDFLDYFVLDNRYLFFYMADVAGHGASSAFLTIYLKSMISSLIMSYETDRNDTILSPQRTLKEINQAFIKEDFGRHLSLWLGLIDTEEERLTYCNAGHFPLPVIHNGTGPRFISGKSLLLGLIDSAPYQEHIIDLPESFSILLFSDGVMEVIHEKNLQKQKNILLEAVNNCAGGLDAVSELLELDQCQGPPDDVTVLCIQKQKK